MGKRGSPNAMQPDEGIALIKTLVGEEDYSALSKNQVTFLSVLPSCNMVIERALAACDLSINLHWIWLKKHEEYKRVYEAYDDILTDISRNVIAKAMQSDDESLSLKAAVFVQARSEARKKRAEKKPSVMVQNIFHGGDQAAETPEKTAQKIKLTLQAIEGNLSQEEYLEGVANQQDEDGGRTTN